MSVLDRLPVSGTYAMRTREEIRRSLSNKVVRTRTAFDAASREIRDVASDIPSGLPRPGGIARIRVAQDSYRVVSDAYCVALCEFNAFAIDGTIPERLQESSRLPASLASPETRSTRSNAQ